MHAQGVSRVPPESGGDTRIYLVEDDPTILQFVLTSLLSRPQWRLVGVSESLLHAGQHALAAQADVYLVDLGLPDGVGEDLLLRLSRERPEAELLVFTVFGEESRLMGALQAGATGYVLKGCTPAELVAAIEQIREGGAPISPLLARMLLRQFRDTQAITPEASPADALDQVVLSDRETDVLKLVAQGYVNKEIALKLEISPTTVSTHIKNLYRKMAVHSRVQVVRAALQRGLL